MVYGLGFRVFEGPFVWGGVGRSGYCNFLILEIDDYAAL